MYTPVISSAAAAESASDKNKACMLYKAYKLSDHRTFQSFFHPDKDAILSLVDQFTAKKGKFAIPGYPQKLGFLLHGPPGTGKVRDLTIRSRERPEKHLRVVTSIAKIHDNTIVAPWPMETYIPISQFTFCTSDKLHQGSGPVHQSPHREHPSEQDQDEPGADEYHV
jgi:hypothetical protein